MHRRAAQGIFGGRFGGRKSLQSRKSCTFGGTFGGRRFLPETKLMHVRRHLQRPKLPSRAESPLSGAGFGSQKLASTGRFGGQKSLWLPNLSSSKGQNSACFMHNASKTNPSCIYLFYNMQTQALKLLGASNYPKPQLTTHQTYINIIHCSKRLNINP